ncbi:MAG: C45 family autoproteolytic acyltransferase/hydrolase [Polyangiaceae bacterium]
MTKLTLRTLSVRGTPRELGQAQGEALREPIAAFVAQRLEALRGYLGERGESARYDEFVAVGKACLEAAHRFDPAGSEEHDAIADAAGIARELLYAACNMTDVRDVLVLPARPDREGCTSVLLPKSHTKQGQIVVGQTWDLNPTDLDFVVGVHRKPTQGPETWSVTCVGALSLMGMNEHGVSVGTTNIKTRASRVGVGYLSILHRALNQRSFTDAAQVVRNAPRAAAHTYWLASAEQAILFETDPDLVVERALLDDALVQTNHCQGRELAGREGEAQSASSRARLLRAERVLATTDHDLDSVRALFADRADGVDSINRYAEDAQGTTTNACLVCCPATRDVLACRGPADRGEWQKLEFEAR